MLCVVFSSCEKEMPKFKAEKGGIDVITNIYFKASEGLDSVKSYQVSKLNYHGDDIIELVPDLNFPQFISQVYFIKDTLCCNMGTVERARKIIAQGGSRKWFSVYKKSNGVVFFKDLVPEYTERRDISDTILFNKKYKRFEINTLNNFTRYYIYETDTVFPYSLNAQIDKDYGGRLERIDSYSKVQDMFITVQLLPRKIDDEAQDMFDFKAFVNNRNKK